MGDKPFEDGREEGAHVDSVETREDGKKALVERVLRGSSLGNARNVDMQMAVWEGVVANGGVEKARALHPSTERKAAKFSW